MLKSNYEMNISTKVIVESWPLYGCFRTWCSCRGWGCGWWGLRFTLDPSSFCSLAVVFIPSIKSIKEFVKSKTFKRACYANGYHYIRLDRFFFILTTEVVLLLGFTHSDNKF